MNRPLTRAAILAASCLLAACERVEAPPANEAAASNATADAEAAPQPPAASGPAAPDASNPPVALAATGADLRWGPCPPGMPEGCEIAVLHGDPAKPNADVFLKVPAKYVIPPHWHTSAERMVLVAGELEIEYAGHPATTLKAGTYAYGPAKAPHKASCAKGAACMLFIAFEAPVDAVKGGGEE